MQLSDDLTATTRVVFSLPDSAGEYAQTVYVDPYTVRVDGSPRCRFACRLSSHAVTGVAPNQVVSCRTRSRSTPGTRR
ncbi:hypothetical protein [Saccharothrix luteola]|uniref:hypothetical protein n=1 Tax=Saccharothrix luteola TaxID=2893018 RepID=UPI001E3205FC|nr:hypothetical protein [Saccharothrix luteola]MCC8242998.1 hypothetical protein [Saccharothrix luteola]